MRWGRLRIPETAELETFLREREDRCVGAIKRFMARKPADPLPWLARDGTGRLQGAIIVSGRIVHPVFSETLVPSQLRAPENAAGDNIVRALERILRDTSFPSLPWGPRKRYRSIQGIRSHVEAVEAALARLGYPEPERIDYRLMCLDGPPAEVPPKPGLEEAKIVRASGAAWTDGLYPLQEAYEREEVLPKGAEFHPAGCRRSLEELLKEHYVVAARIDGNIVGKANTNALSYTRAQIGGVYVIPSMRGKSLATRMVHQLFRDLWKDSRGISLFVKCGNAPAIRVYERLGMETRAEYRIAYY